MNLKTQETSMIIGTKVVTVTKMFHKIPEKNSLLQERRDSLNRKTKKQVTSSAKCGDLLLRKCLLTARR